ncbi:hypothetical protein I2494_18445 [Budviciaceae bacterium BWR-B9]|uniref:Uncharacterized protein n=1 Tax=Limnobaculum allomyrinae TaxID=2791986 RepID=A0ABS1IV81_9GAMM|nr:MULTISPECIES: hypothetical protein [Limnobaculum]MBK5145657.1 hypothetical protein [Limnobaculum allomyrinae]MBV7692602.1 hypothetical protein [Limnobaculum sp. M2-1]
MLNLLNQTPLLPEELAEQCFALAYTISSMEQPELKESLLFILQEKQAALLSLLEPATTGE